MIRSAAFLAGVLATAFAVTAAAADRDAAPHSADALIERAIRYEHGEGMARNTVRAAELYCAAARQGSAEAAYRLGWMYANGRGIERDDGYAVALFQRAAAQGHEYAGRMLARIRSDEVRPPECLAAPVSALIARTELAQIEQLALADRTKAETAVAELARAEQLAQAERARNETAQAQLAKAEQLAQAERARAETARAELAKAEQLARAERARAETARAALAKAEQLARATRVARAEEASAGAAAASGELAERNEISSALAGWADAWSRRDLDAYLAAYAKDFLASGGRSLRQWQQERRVRIAAKAWIDVKIRDLEIRVEGNRARARFVQDYRSDRLSESGGKTLTLVKADRRWLIRQEQSAK